MKIKEFFDLNTWKYGHELVIGTYRVTKSFPRGEMYGLTDQLRRCSVSVTSNIAEGFSRKGKREKIQFYYISKGSITELQNQLIIAKDLHYINKDDFNELFRLSTNVHKMLNGMVRSSKSIP